MLGRQPLERDEGCGPGFGNLCAFHACGLRIMNSAFSHFFSVYMGVDVNRMREALHPQQACVTNSGWEGMFVRRACSTTACGVGRRIMQCSRACSYLLESKCVGDCRQK